MEPFRILVDEYVFVNEVITLDLETKLEIVNLLNQKVKINGKSYYLTNAIQIYLRSVFKSLETGLVEELCFFEFE